MRYIKSFEGFHQTNIEVNDTVEITLIGSPYVGRKGIVSSIDSDDIEVELENTHKVICKISDVNLIK